MKINADTAREIADDRRIHHIEDEIRNLLKKIENDISKAASNGLYSYSIMLNTIKHPESLHQIKLILIAKGFIISQPIEQKLVISWAKPA